MYWQRDLPHWIPDSATVFVTWRLAGTLPVPIAAFLTSNPNPGESFARHDRELDRMQSGPVWLKNPRIANIVVSALLHGESVRRSYDLYSWVVMPNHVHAVLKPHSRLPEIMQWLKTATANRANRILGTSHTPFWRREYYDHWVRSEKEFFSIVHYVEQNPVVAGLAASPEECPWSSARRPPTEIADGKTVSATRRKVSSCKITSGTVTGEMTIVVAGVLRQDGRILICRRRADQPHPLKWEFPGGKLEAGESPAAALIRELREELGIESEAGFEIMRYEFAYPGKQPILLVFLEVASWRGDFDNRIFETILWERSEALAEYDFLEGDALFLAAFTGPESQMARRCADSTIS
jgi:mutator protein MutT